MELVCAMSVEQMHVDREFASEYRHPAYCSGPALHEISLSYMILRITSTLRGDFHELVVIILS